MNDKLVPIVGKLPAKARPVPRWKRLDRLASKLDEVADLYSRLHDARLGLRNCQPAQALQCLDQAEMVAAEVEASRGMLAQCRESLQVLDPEEHYEDADDDDGPQLKQRIIATRLAVFVGSFPGGAPNGDPDAYAAALVAHVEAIDGLRFIALDDACREVAERKSARDFLPVPGALVDAIREKMDAWSERLDALDMITERARILMADIEQRRPKIVEDYLTFKFEERSQAAKACNEAREAVRQARQNACEQQSRARDDAQGVWHALDRLRQCEAAEAAARRKLVELVDSVARERARLRHEDAADA